MGCMRIREGLKAENVVLSELRCITGIEDYSFGGFDFFCWEMNTGINAINTAPMAIQKASIRGELSGLCCFERG